MWQIEYLFGASFAAKFAYWMRGQTVSVTENGLASYYKHDLKRYINGLIDNDGEEPDILD